MKKLIFILFAFLAFETNAQTIPSHPTIKLTKPATGGGTDDVLTIGSSKTINKVSKASLLSGLATSAYVNAADATKEPVITEGTTSQYFRGDKTWQTLPTYTLSGLGGEPSIASGTNSQYFRGDKTWQEFPAPNIYPLQINTTNNTVWNNGKGNISTNTSFGQHALRSNLYSGNYNTAYGYTALMQNTSGVENTAFGAGALSLNVLGSYNTVIGSQAGYYFDGMGGLENSNESVFIGRRCYPGGTTYGQCTNAIVIGANAIGAGSNTATLGNTSITKTVLRGTINTAGLAVYADNAAAIAGGLIVGDMYRTSTGQLMVRY